MKFLFKYKAIIVVVAYLGIIWASFVFVINPLIGKVNSEADKTQEDMLDRENKNKRIGELPKLKEQFDMVESEENKIQVFLTKDKAVDLIKSLESLADKTGNKISISIDEKTPVAAAKKAIPVGDDTANGDGNNGAKSSKISSIVDDLPKLNSLKLKIKLVGHYNDMVNFMTKLENFDYYSDIISISIDQGDSSENSPRGDLFGQSNSTADVKAPPDVLTSELTGLFYLEQ
jgi:Tfp pilus assembly protein PilO